MNAPALTPQCLSHLSYSKFQFYILIWSQEVKARLELSCHTLKTLISNFFLSIRQNGFLPTQNSPTKR